MLKVEVVLEIKIRHLILNQRMNPGHYEAPFFPTVETI